MTVAVHEMLGQLNEFRRKMTSRLCGSGLYVVHDRADHGEHSYEGG